jgi:hypothetical protein
MKYMTADLVAKLQDENMPDAAAEEWERAIDAYRRHLRSIWDDLPSGAKTLFRRYCPHDVRVLDIAVYGKHPIVLIFLRLDEPYNKDVLLQYVLVKNLEIYNHPSLDKLGEPWQEWDYDEFDAVEENGNSYFTHSILFSGGRELKISFKDLRCRPIRKFFRPMQRANGTGDESELQLA